MALLEELAARLPEMVADLDMLVSAESPSTDLGAIADCAEAVATLGQRLLRADPERIVTAGRVHLRWTFGVPRVAILGHLDTVWPRGTIVRWPFSVAGERATGPGAFDMKAGIVQGLHALAALGAVDGVEILFTSDEEIGSPTSRPLVEETARRVGAVLVLEPSADGALKTSRKGTSLYTLEIQGRAAHAGLEPEVGVNALTELAHQVLAMPGLARPDQGTTAVPTVAQAGTVTNVVPATARLDVDVRVVDAAEQERVDRQIRAVQPVIAGARVTVSGGPNRPPLPASASGALFATARRLGAALGMADLAGVQVGGGSDGNFAAAVGTATLDGLGPVGGGAHAEGEHVVIPAMSVRAALVAALVDELRQC